LNGFRPLSRRCQGERREQGRPVAKVSRRAARAGRSALEWSPVQAKQAGRMPFHFCFVSACLLPAPVFSLFSRCSPTAPPQRPGCWGAPEMSRAARTTTDSRAGARRRKAPAACPLITQVSRRPPCPVAVDMYRKGAGPLPTVCPCAARAAGDTPLAPPHQVRRGRGSGGYKSTGARSSAVPTASANSWSSRSLTVHPRFGSGRHTPSMPQCHTRRARKG